MTYIGAAAVCAGLLSSAGIAAAQTGACLRSDPGEYRRAEGRDGLYALLIPEISAWLARGEAVPWDCIIADYESLGPRFWVEVIVSTDGSQVGYRFFKRMLDPRYYTDLSARYWGAVMAAFLVDSRGVSLSREGVREWLPLE